MDWSGEFHFGSSFAIFCGTAADNSLHQHAAFQLAIGQTSEVVVRDALGRDYVKPAVLIRPMAKHAILSTNDLNIVYFDSKSPLRNLFDVRQSEEITGIPTPHSSRLHCGIPSEVLSYVEWLSAQTNPVALDARLLQALTDLSKNLSCASVSQTARHCGISESRLRTLAKEQLGIPLSTWLIWMKLTKASQALAAGVTQSSAASAGGFSDQAHFCGTMRRLFGITPKMAQSILSN